MPATDIAPTTQSRPPQIDPALTAISSSSPSAPPENGPSQSSTKDSSSKATRTRTAITELERKSLRDHADLHPTIPHKDLAAWFQNTFSHRIAQSSISDSLGPRFSYLDSLSVDDLAGDGESKRRREPSFPQLERKLVEWFEGCAARGEQVTGDLVKKAAGGLWMGMSEYSRREMPKWSNGWLEGWKQRNGINFKAHLPEGEKTATRRNRSEVDDQIEMEIEGAKRRKMAHLQQVHNDSTAQSASGTLPWDMLRPERSGLQSGEVEAWDMLRPVAASLRESGNADSRLDSDNASTSSDSPEPAADLNRPGYDPSMPAWLRLRTWDELPWVKDGSMGLPKGRSRQKKRRRTRKAPRDVSGVQGDEQYRTDEQQNIQESAAQGGSAERPIAVNTPTAFDMYGDNPSY